MSLNNTQNNTDNKTITKRIKLTIFIDNMGSLFSCPFLEGAKIKKIKHVDLECLTYSVHFDNKKWKCWIYDDSDKCILSTKGEFYHDYEISSMLKDCADCIDDSDKDILKELIELF